MANNINYFPSNLKFLRKVSRLTQSQIADKIVEFEESKKIYKLTSKFLKQADENLKIKYKTPWVEGVDVLTVPEPKYAENISTSPEVLDFIKLFKKDPKSNNPNCSNSIFHPYLFLRKPHQK